ncbi:MAG: ATP-binding protein [Acidimicrobiia bacterium]|nr:ATP-binding protein [Acidimicrobiia bacterium]
MVSLNAAQDDPAGFVADLPDRVILDEAQRVPELFSSIKLSIDRDRRPGRFVLTGSTNVMLVPRLADSLAGRMQILRLHPLSQTELARVGRHADEIKPESGFLDALFGGGFGMSNGERLGPNLREGITNGGYPAALTRPPGRRRIQWYTDYINAVVQHDVNDLTRITRLDALPRLLQASAAQTARLFNVSRLAAPFQLSLPTIRTYLVLLERMFLLERLAPWYNNRLKRLVKTPKLHLGDTGLACALLRIGPERLQTDRVLLGQLTETFVYQELRRQSGWYHPGVRFFHYRDKDGAEVDVVLEQGGGRIAGIEVKAGATVRSGDFRGLRKLAKTVGDRFAAGVVLYDGEISVGFGPKLRAVPIRRLWERPPLP